MLYDIEFIRRVDGKAETLALEMVRGEVLNLLEKRLGCSFA